MKKPYNKAPLSFQDQLNLMKSRGLVVGNEQRALSYLQEISYYRLSAYFLPYQKIKDQFDKGTTFEKIIDTYSFDRELRLLVFDCIERVEVAIRTQMIYQMALFPPLPRSRSFGTFAWFFNNNESFSNFGINKKL